ncbi:hypothetical protein [Vibrio parahaemolyticus]|uniref:hypothetical protein n=1 Tax=Vibrio parahaemolyticus TaxID=670 RepID=UPI001302AA65|nr:hypothetical protein [Vibrio parahaemolyticus]
MKLKQNSQTTPKQDLEQYVKDSFIHLINPTSVDNAPPSISPRKFTSAMQKVTGLDIKSSSLPALKQTLMKLIDCHERLSNILNQRQGGFRATKLKLSSVLGVSLRARSWEELQQRVSLLISLCNTETDLAEKRFNQTKINSFIGSSSLESIDISETQERKELHLKMLSKYGIKKHG